MGSRAVAAAVKPTAAANQPNTGNRQWRVKPPMLIPNG
jgi:hypothetical protein